MEWIALKDKTPNNNETVITWSQEGMRICRYTNEVGLFGKPIGEHKFCNLMSKWMIVDKYVTHWMPLPKPPNN